MGEDWGKNNLAKAYVAMKDFQMLPLDTSITNTENALNFQHWQVLNLEQTNRLMSRIQLSNHFKIQAFEAIGISPQRMGTVTSQETATGVETAVNQSYSQTEMYFTQHSEYLMPRVHQMRTDLAQYYNSQSPSVRLQYMTSLDEKVNFEINGTDLLSRELNVFVTTKINHKQILEQIRSLAINNNASGASIYDLGNIVKADSMAEMNHVMKSIEEKANQQMQAQREHEQRMQEEANQSAAQRQQEMLQYEADQKERDRETKIRVAEIQAAGYAGGRDVNENSEVDYLDTLKYLDNKDLNNQKMQLAKDKQLREDIMSQRQLDLKEREMRSKEKISQQQLAIARENKNKYDEK